MNTFQKGISEAFGPASSSPHSISAPCLHCKAIVSATKWGPAKNGRPPRRNALAAASRLVKAERLHLEAKHPELWATMQAETRKLWEALNAWKREGRTAPEGART